MAKIDVDGYDSEYTENESVERNPKRKNKRKAVKIRRLITRILVLALSAGCVAGAYPAGKILFDRTLVSDKEVEVIPGWVLDLIPTGIFSGLLDKVSNAAGIETGSNEEESEEQQEEEEIIDDPNILSSTTPVSDSYITASVFLGDEALLGFVEEDLLNEKLVYAERGLRPTDFLEKEFTDPLTNLTGTVSSLIPAREPEQIYLCMNLSGLMEEDYLESYRSLIQSLKAACPNASIIVCSLLPINRDNIAEGELDENIQNGTIDSTNKQILAMVREEGVYYLNAYSKLASGGALKEKYDSGNGITLSSDGYDAWLSYIQKHAVPTS